jgi:hypothetical protein
MAIFRVDAEKEAFFHNILNEPISDGHLSISLVVKPKDFNIIIPKL